VSVLGVHGGAGESTLADWVDATPAGHAWPTPPAEYPWHWPKDAEGEPVAQPVLLVAKTSAAGLTAAQAALREWASGSLPGVDVVGLALVADAAGRLPKPLDYFATVVSGAAPVVVRVPWVEQLRLGLDFNPRHDRAVRAAVAALRHLTSSSPNTEPSSTGHPSAVARSPRPPRSRRLARKGLPR
jgi:hypothetical protein